MRRPGGRGEEAQNVPPWQPPTPVKHAPLHGREVVGVLLEILHCVVLQRHRLDGALEGVKYCAPVVVVKGGGGVVAAFLSAVHNSAAAACRHWQRSSGGGGGVNRDDCKEGSSLVVGGGGVDDRCGQWW